MKYSLLLLCPVLLLSLKPVSSTRDDSRPSDGGVAAKLRVSVRKRVPVVSKPGSFTLVNEQQQWDPAQTAIIICDMWDQHWCKSATARVGELAPHINQVLNIARSRGVLIVHSPSETMDYYKDYPGRKLAQKYAQPGKEELDGDKCLASETGVPWPIDQSDGGCPDTPACTQRLAWKKQIASIEIKEGDVISDSGNEIVGMFRQKGIKRVILMGVHTNMCIIGRSFGMRNMQKSGIEAVLMRDMTDAMYDPRQAPFVNHFQGVDLVIEYIEKYIGPSIVSTDFTGQPAFRFSQDTRGAK